MTDLQEDSPSAAEPDPRPTAAGFSGAAGLSGAAGFSGAAGLSAAAPRSGVPAQYGPAERSYEVPLSSVAEGLIAVVADLDGIGAFDAVAPFGLADDEVVAATVLAEKLGRVADAARVRFAGLIAERSEPERGDARLTVRHGVPTVPKLVARLTGVSIHSAKGRITLAAAAQSTMSLIGTSNESNFPAVEKALIEGLINVDAAAVITEKLTQAARRSGFGADLHEAEDTLVLAARPLVDGGTGFTADEVDLLATRLREHLDPDGAEPRDEDLQEKRGMTLTSLPSGWYKIAGLLPPDVAAKWLALAESFLSPRTRPSFSGGAAGAEAETGIQTEAETNVGGDPTLVEPRTRPQLLLDGFTELLVKAAGLPEMPRLNGARPTVNLHASLSDVVSGRGVGWIDGLVEPVPVSTVRQLLCHGDFITTLLGENGRVMQHGKTRRLFTAAQNRALAVRDGGCVWPGCERPPSWAETHHVTPWLTEYHPRGPTDIDNGVLLCHFHHANVHKSGWRMVMRDGVPHIIPPPCVDWRQTPRPCTQRRTSLQ
ncbi:HNH endonuclease [Subtercola sp. PAMC28395]|uniref:HNH endonuclease signature motif containing protein n=1 Tax=Subtercola sp. PAMC28395 TaxID=2846775 RepID=UPI001C0E04FB|nr:HNH endonuclease signature motif containing protein [Subtercola sp. PAMC28395]QWT23859.1 HNH endonuclease [Subtercola sp. PAMC28395]